MTIYGWGDTINKLKTIIGIKSEIGLKKEYGKNST